MSQLLDTLLWNACLAACLAVVVFAAQRIRRLRCQPSLWHALWLLVLIKLVTPPIIAVPVFWRTTSTAQQQPDHAASTPLALSGATSAEGAVAAALVARAKNALLTPHVALAISAIGTVGLLLASLSRIRLIGRLVRHAAPAPDWMREAAATAARQLKLKRVPSLVTVDGRVAPFLWVTPTRPLVVVPRQLAAQLDPTSVRLIIKHELSHYARRDHCTNTFAMILGALFWWNPVVWWARRELRILQEVCCDSMVLEPDFSHRHRYAEALLRTVDFVASADAALPTPATAFASCATFKRRLEMIVSGNPHRVYSRCLQACVLLCAAAVLPFGLAQAQDYEAVGKRLKAAVKAGELTSKEARAMLAALKALNSAEKDQNTDRVKQHLAEVNRELGAAVEAGKISKEDAVKRYKAAEKLIKQRIAAAQRRERRAGRTSREDFVRAEARLRKALADGKIDKDAARAKLSEMRKKIGEKGERDAKLTAREQYARAEAKIKRAVDEGKVSAEDARKRLAAMRKSIAERSGEARADWEGIKKRIEGAVERGDLTREEADAKYREIRKGLAKRKDDARSDREGLSKRIEAAVKRGDLTRKEADAKYAAIRKEKGSQGKKVEKRDWRAIKRRIEGAVKRGDLSRDQANAQYRDPKKNK